MVSLDDTSRPAATQPVHRRRWRRWLAAAIALLVASVLFGAYGWQPGEDGRAFRSPYLAQVGSHYADTPIARFHYVQAGSGTPVILLSPGGTSVIGWKDQLTVLARDHTVYVVDLPGQGYTRLKDSGFAFDLDAMVSAVGAFMDSLGVRQAALAGNSWSGGWALAFAQRHPDRVTKLALLDATGLDLPGTLIWESLKIPVIGELAVKLSTGKSTVRSLAEGMMVNKGRVSEQLLDEWWAPMTFRDNIRATYLLERRLDWAQTERALPATKTPTLVLWGKQDTIQPVQRAHRLAELLPNEQLVILDGCGHAPQLDCPDPVNRHLQTFFADS
ncbi:alpha/beta fold hydrolase [Nonomuraea africana]|uniref:Pimeloyl-ACP methyl ester carboxylesterase n=1 Tax=Nonomuraea africana TaxID=46171 RepID=A0ABR9KE46_9ACTN|nr:alpha/beta hydrolase [Nonomuraea africana]MBE1560085.1 pimeloyl-ACP methyl ester carboxylesterase [Nonomuraea africana]